MKQRGYRVGTIKHHSHPGFELDRPGKDTWRHAEAGSDHVVIAAPDKVASIRRVDREPTLDEITATNRGLPAQRPVQDRGGARRPGHGAHLRAG